MTRRPTVLIVDDHPLYGQALAGVVAQVDPAAAVRLVPTLAAARAAIEEDRPALVLLDLALPDATGGQAAAALSSLLPGVPILVISATDDRPLRHELEACGIRGFVSKAAAPAQIAAAVRRLLPPGPVPAGRPTALSQRQMEVLREMASGKTNKEIARLLGISVETVRAHVVEILARLGARNRTEAVRAFYTGGCVVQPTRSERQSPSAGD